MVADLVQTIRSFLKQFRRAVHAAILRSFEKFRESDTDPVSCEIDANQLLRN